MRILRSATPHLIRLAILSGLCVGVVAPAAAQTATARPQPAPASATNVVAPGHWSITPFLGVGFSGDISGATGALGAAAGYAWTDRVGFEGELNVLPSPENDGLVTVGTHVWSLTGNVLYHFGGQDFKPYGVFGIGFGHAGADLSSVNVNTTTTTTANTTTGTTATNLNTSSTSFVVDFGGGVERKITDRLALRGDLRYFFGGDLVPDYWRLGAGVRIDMGPR